jgi:hypothetical protein
MLPLHYNMSPPALPCCAALHCRDQALGQYQKYVNRYGPGLVIYWHGYIRDLAQLEGGEDVLLLDRFPNPHELLTLPRLPLALAFALWESAGGQPAVEPAVAAPGAAVAVAAAVSGPVVTATAGTAR